MAEFGCRICEAADGQYLGDVPLEYVMVHAAQHQPTTAGYDIGTGKVYRTAPPLRLVEEPEPPGNRWVEREPYSTGRAIVDDDDCPEPRATITDEAYGLVMGDRQSDYNHPSDDFKATGRQWGAVLTNWLHSEGMVVANEEFTHVTGDVPDVPPHIVALMMAQLKISRESHKPKHDNRVDAIGYIVCADRIVEGY